MAAQQRPISLLEPSAVWMLLADFEPGFLKGWQELEEFIRRKYATKP
jgi:hypothetical protein